MIYDLWSRRVMKTKLENLNKNLYIVKHHAYVWKIKILCNKSRRNKERKFILEGFLISQDEYFLDTMLQLTINNLRKNLEI